MPDQNDNIRYLRVSFGLAEEAARQGVHPFAALLVDEEGRYGAGQCLSRGPRHDRARRARTATRACIAFASEKLARCTLNNSAEPGAMCAGAIYLAGIGRVVYGASERRLKDMTGDHPENPTMDLPCRIVFAAGQRAVEVTGPLVEEEAVQLHHRFW